MNELILTTFDWVPEMQRATARPSFVKAHADQMAYYAAVD
ncbi:hypothetical protein Q427_12835 [Halomonas sp. BC04]|nr:hypothetical protein Q427_12835 [Halomonas sp. BC04]